MMIVTFCADVDFSESVEHEQKFLDALYKKQLKKPLQLLFCFKSLKFWWCCTKFACKFLHSM